MRRESILAVVEQIVGIYVEQYPYRIYSEDSSKKKED
jgi:hypothetical protein